MSTALQKTSLSEPAWNTLMRRIARGRCTPFIGHGVREKLKPTWSDIAAQLAEKYDCPFTGQPDLAHVAQYIAVEIDPAEARDVIQESFEHLQEPDFSDESEPHRVLAELPLPIYISTNFDGFMVDALRNQKKDVRYDWPIWSEAACRPGGGRGPFDEEASYVPTVANPLVYHCFGHLEHSGSLVVTEDDYLAYLVRTTINDDCIPFRIQQAFKNTSLLFLGFEPTDLEFRVLLRRLEIAKDRKHVSVQVFSGETKDEQRQCKMREYLEKLLRYEQHDFDVYWGSCRDFVAELSDRWKEYERNGRL